MANHTIEENTPMSDPIRSTRSVRHGRRRRVVAVMSALAIAAVVVVATTASPHGSTASALPPRCPGGAPPPCITVPTTVAPPPKWNVNVLTLNQDPAGLSGAVAASRSWILKNGATAGAGSASLVNNTFAFPVSALPTGAKVALRVTEAGSPGSLCRTTPVAPLPASGTQLHILAVPPIAESAADLNALVSSFKGPATGLPAGVTATIVGAVLKPTANGLALGLLGTMHILTANVNFLDLMPLTLTPVNGTDVSQVLTTQVGPGLVGLSWVGTPPANVAAILAKLKPTVESDIQASVANQAGPAVNSAVLGLSEVQWWTEQGFTVSVRKVTYTAAAMQVSAALCRLG